MSKSSFVSTFVLNGERVKVYSSTYKGQKRLRYISRFGVVTAGSKKLAKDVLIESFVQAAKTGRDIHLETTK